eukprot:scaffold45374_cov230-Isochrysis_galbana.AAC.1
MPEQSVPTRSTIGRAASGRGRAPLLLPARPWFRARLPAARLPRYFFSPRGSDTAEPSEAVGAAEA